MQGSPTRWWTTPSLRRSAAFAAAALALGAARPAGAHSNFHLHLVRSDPAADANLSAPPSALRLTFSERPELAVTTVRLTNQANRAVALSRVAPAGRDRATVIARVRTPLAPGRYTVSWRTMSHDGHPMHGSFHFSVGARPHGH